MIFHRLPAEGGSRLEALNRGGGRVPSPPGPCHLGRDLAKVAVVFTGSEAR